MQTSFIFDIETCHDSKRGPGFKDITGDQIGIWKVISCVGHNKQNQAVWRCRCQCGKEREIPGVILRQGKLQICRCSSRMIGRQLKNITGQRFGQLLVLKFVGINKNRNAEWLCQCICGAEKIVTGIELRSGHRKSCGCGMRWRRNLAKTHCPQGHAYDQDNTELRDDGHRICKACRRERGWRKRGINGMTEETFAEMFEAQTGNCQVCRKPLVLGHDLHVDHDHETGRVRGLLHNKCNVLLGYADDDPEILIAAALYLKQHRHTGDYIAAD